MKTKTTRLTSLLFAAGSSLLAASPASAVSGTWLGNGLDWNDSAAWSGGIIADASGSTANFTGVNLTSDVSMALGANRTIDDIIFTDATSSSHNLTLTGNTLTLAGTPGINVTQAERNLTISSILAGTAGFTKTGQGTLTLTGSNSITGATSISGGGRLILDYTTNDNRKLANNSTLSLAAGTIVFKGGTATENFTSTTFNTGNNGTFFVRDGGSAKINLNAFTVGAGSSVSFSHDSMATTDRTNVAGIMGAWFTAGNRWATNAGVGGAGGSAGAGAAADGDIVGYTGGTTFTPAAATNFDVNYDLAGSATLTGSRTVNTLRIESTADDQVLDLGANNNLQTSNFTGTNALAGTSGGLLYAGGANGNYTITGTNGGLLIENQNGQGQLIHVYGGTLTMDARVGSGSSPLVKSGEGTLVLKKDNAYGSLRVYQGVVRLGHNNALDTTSTVQHGAAIELSNGISVGAFASTITGTGISNGGALRSVATTTSSFAGAITIGTGGARINSDSTGTFTLSGGVVTSSGNNVTFGGAGNTIVSTAAISGAGGLVKDGAGTATLSFANTYTGATMVHGGTLVVEGSTAATGLVNVSAGATIGGSGSIGDLTILDGDLAPGGGVDHSFQVNNLTLDPVSNLRFGLAHPMVAGDNDIVNVTETLTLGGQLHVSPQSGAPAYAFTTAAPGTQWTLFTYAQGNLTISGDLTIVSAPTLASGLGWRVDTTSSNSSVFLVVVPEAGSAALLGLGLFVLLLRRRDPRA